ncbi:hypothetical protein [Cellulomonas bogoriensis]|uniref:Uncharacterized protein n=1 Tax=Cellulomonas bogoriensis 69B4 = DSM 16987 TaxID=1386082 RepID=A0A0A0BP48_9CELL|nr:hypothetical protein [Cellulomonas bogoriensis]KGM09715.1 hypothetical protein N869_06300 [Cellulomonas bogoriensis 69B4 = DSM 16987]
MEQNEERPAGERTDARTAPDGPDAAHQVPEGVDDATVEAVGRLTAALEVVEQARGMLYGFHRMTGRGDNDLADALDALEAAGHRELAQDMRRDLLGRNVVSHRWTFQVVEDYDDGYWQPFRDWEKRVRDALVGGRRHLYEAQLKEANRTHGRPGHEARPGAHG